MAKHQQQTYAERMRKAMRDQNITLRDMQKSLGYSYEHLRKIRTGRPLLSRDVSNAISAFLGLDDKVMWELASVEKMKHKFGQVPAELVPPADDRMKQYWAVLTREEKEEIISVAEAYYKKHQLLNRAENEDELVQIIANASERLGQMKKRAAIAAKRTA